MNYQKRQIEFLLENAAKRFSVIVITGARQTGKSTLLKNIFPSYSYFTLDDPLNKEQIVSDPKSIINKENLPVIIDEIQYAPEVLPYIKMLVDENREMKGQIIITGSQNFTLMKDVTESLAGRAAILTLPVFSVTEFSPDDIDKKEPCFTMLHKGFFPEQMLSDDDSVSLYYSSYIQTYLERDVRQIINVSDLNQFQSFISIIAARSGSLFNLNTISKEIGVAFNTAKRWLGVLQTSGIITLVQPYFANIKKRLIKSPKVIFNDTGILAHLLKYPNSIIMAVGPMAGNFFETFIISEIYKYKQNHNALFDIYFYRDSNGTEVDVILEFAGKFLLFEIKISTTAKKEYTKNLDKIMNQFKDSKAFIIGFFDKDYIISKDISIVNWTKLHSILDEHFAIKN